MSNTSLLVRCRENWPTSFCAKQDTETDRAYAVARDLEVVHRIATRLVWRVGNLVQRKAFTQ